MNDFDLPLHTRLRIFWTRLRLDFKILVCLFGLVLILAPLGWFVGRPWYQDWTQGQTLDIARKSLERGDKAAFHVAIQRFLASTGGSTRDWVAAAELLDHEGNKDAVKVWREVLRRDPESISSRLSYLAAALRADDLFAAGAAIESSDAAFRANPRFPPLAGKYYLRIGDFQTAQVQYERAIASQSADGATLADYGAFLISSDREERRDRGIELLELAIKDPSAALSAGRALFRHDLNARWYYSAGKRLDVLLALPGATMEDRLLVLDLDLAKGGRVDPDHLKALIKEAAPAPGTIEILGGGLLTRGLLSEARTVFDEVPPNAAAAAPLPLLRLRLACATGDWPQAARVARVEVRNLAVADALEAAMAPPPLDDDKNLTWRRPIDLAAGDRVALDVLRAYYASTGHLKEEMPVVQQLIDLNPGDMTLWNRLLEICRLTRDTAMLRRFTSELSEAVGEPPDLEGEVLTLDLLTDRISPSEALSVARGLRNRNMASPAAANAEAFALARMGRGAAAALIYRKFPEQAWADPGRSVLVGYALAQAGNFTAAEARFAEAERHPDRLLVEHEVLIARSRDAMPVSVRESR